MRMRMRSTVLAIGVVVATVIGCGDGHDGGEDLAKGLVSFQYSLGPGLGFCPQPGFVATAEIARDAAGALAVRGSVLDHGVPGRDDCVPQVSSGECFVERAIAARTLGEAEIADVSRVFRSIDVETRSESSCGTGDPCLVRRFVWINDVGHGEAVESLFDGTCAPFLAHGDVRDVTALVRRLLLEPR
jgi:hypothetical protein